MDITQHLNDREQFTNAVRTEIQTRVYQQLDTLKREMANDFIKNVEDQND